MFERYTDRARQIVTLAQEEARDLHHTQVEPEHLVMAMVHEGEGLAAKIINVPLRQARTELFSGGIDYHTPMPLGHLPFTTAAKRCLEFSLREALILGHNYVGTEHMLLGVLRYLSKQHADGASSVADDFLSRHSVTLLSAKQYFAGLSPRDYAGAGRTVLMRELVSLNRQIDRKTVELKELVTSRDEIARHLAGVDNGGVDNGDDAANTTPA